MLYRAWARQRARHLAHWLQAHGAAPPQGVFDAALALAMELEQARESGHTFQGFAHAWSKAYGRVSHVSLWQAFAAALIAARVAGPLLSVYTAPRRVRAHGILGSAWRPASGLPGDCPAAVYTLAVVLIPWRAATQAAAPASVSRLYVDDSSISRCGPDNPEVCQAPATAARLTQAYAAAWAGA